MIVLFQTSHRNPLDVLPLGVFHRSCDRLLAISPRGHTFLESLRPKQELDSPLLALEINFSEGRIFGTSNFSKQPWYYRGWGIRVGLTKFSHKEFFGLNLSGNTFFVGTKGRPYRPGFF